MKAASDDAIGVLVDLTKCNGCRQCEAACRKANGFEVPRTEALRDPSVFEKRRLPGPSNYTTVNRFTCESDRVETGEVYVKSNCLHCLDPACVSACIVGALTKQPDGPVVYDAHKCMGCRYCMVACPFQIPAYDYHDALTPQVRKCMLCVGNSGHTKGSAPACVQACPKECMTFGKRSDLLARAHEKIAAHPETYVNHVYGEHEAGGTTWMYLSAVPFEEIGFLSVDSKAPPRLTETIQHGVFNHFVPPLAWCGLLGLAMLTTRPNPPQPPSSSPEVATEPKRVEKTSDLETADTAEDDTDDSPRRTHAA